MRILPSDIIAKKRGFIPNSVNPNSVRPWILDWEKHKLSRSLYRRSEPLLPFLDARLWVKDGGPGISKEDHERIFEQFYRRGSELRRETSGVGIGLTLVRHTMDAHQSPRDPSRAGSRAQAGVRL